MAATSLVEEVGVWGRMVGAEGWKLWNHVPSSTSYSLVRTLLLEYVSFSNTVQRLGQWRIERRTDNIIMPIANRLKN